MTIVCDSADPLKTWLYKLKCTFKLILCKWFHEFHLALRDDRKISQIHYCYMSCMYVCNETLVVNSVARLNHVEPSVRPGSQEQPLKATDAEVEVGERPTCLQVCFYRIQKNKIKTVKLSGSLQSFVFKKNKQSNVSFWFVFFCLICALEQRKTYLRSRASVLKFQLPTLFSDYSRPEQKARTFSALKQTISRSFFIKLEVEQAAMSVCYSRN